jgi:hypothetical protein
MVDNLIAKTYDLRIVSHINDSFVKARPRYFKFRCPNCYLISNGMGGDNEAFMTIEIRRGFYDDCRIYGSIRKWYHGAISENDLRWEEFIEAIDILEQILELPEKELYKFTLSKIEVGLGAKIPYDSTYVKTQIVGFKRSSYKIGNFEGYRKFATNNQDRIAKIYDKKTEIRKKMRLIKSIEENQFIERTKELNIFRPEFTVQKGKANVRECIGIETIGDIVAHYPRLLAYFLRQIKYFQFKNNPDLEFNPTKGSVKEFTDYLLNVAINYLGAVGVRDIISQLASDYQSDARRKVKKLTVDSGSNNKLKENVIRALQNQSVDLFRRKVL